MGHTWVNKVVAIRTQRIVKVDGGPDQHVNILAPLIKLFKPSTEKLPYCTFCMNNFSIFHAMAPLSALMKTHYLYTNVTNYLNNHAQLYSGARGGTKAFVKGTKIF